MILDRNRHKVKGFPDLLLYDAMVSNGVLLLRDGTFLAGWRYRGPDMASRTHVEMAALSARVSQALMLGSGWMWQLSAIRSEAPGYPDGGAFPDAVTRMIDEERRREFMENGRHYESEYFCSLSYQPPVAAEEKMRGWAFEGAHANGDAPALRALERFEEKLERVEDSLRASVTIERLRTLPNGHDDLLRYVRRTYTGEDHPIMLPAMPVCLQDVIGCVDFVGGVEPRIGNKHVRVVSIDGYPLQSWPGILHALDELPIEYRWASRAVMMDPEEARVSIEFTRRKWRGKVHKFFDKMKEVPTGPRNLDALKMEQDCSVALEEVEQGRVQFCHFDSQLIFHHLNPDAAEEAVDLAIKVVQNSGFACRRESVNAIESFRGSLPGDGYSNLRRTLVHSLNAADMLPLTSVWTGARENPSSLMPPHSPPLLYAATTGATPFRFHLHVDDVGHSFLAGPPGAGKSTMLALMAASWFRFQGARVVSFDKLRSMYALTKAVGGSFFDVGGDKSVSFCPLQHLETDSDMTWAAGWLESLCVLQSLQVTPRERNLLSDALKLLRAAPRRTMTALVANVQDRSIRDALQPYLVGEPLGNLLDAESDTISESHFVDYELSQLMRMGQKAVAAVLPYLFRRIARPLETGRGEPVLVTIDEAWEALREDAFREMLRDWLKTFRKLNCAVVLATQNLSDIFRSPISDVILENCPTKVLLPNAEALNPESRGYYERLGLEGVEIEQIRDGVPKRQYYVVSPDGRRMLDISLGEVACAFCGVSGREDLMEVERLIREHGEEWPHRWLESRMDEVKV